MLIELARWVFALIGMFVAWDYVTAGGTLDEPIGLIGWGFVVIIGGGAGAAIGVAMAWPIMVVKSFVDRIKAGVNDMSNDKIADNVVTLALSEFGEQLRDAEVDIIYVDQKPDDEKDWTKYYYKATSPVLDKFESEYGQSFGFVFRMHEGWKPQYFVDMVRGKNNRMAEVNKYVGGDIKAAASIIAKTAREFHDTSLSKLKKLGSVPTRNDGSRF